MKLLVRGHYRPNKCLIGPKIGQIRPKDMPPKAKDTRQIRLENARINKTCAIKKRASTSSQDWRESLFGATEDLEQKALRWLNSPHYKINNAKLKIKVVYAMAFTTRRMNTN